MAKQRAAPAVAIEYPICARHSQPRKDVRLRHCFLCDGCAERWTVEAFDGNRSSWDGASLSGYCLLCNGHTNVLLRTWFLCDICWRVAGSIGRNHVAEKLVIDSWQERVERTHPHLKIEQNDASSLRPRRRTDVSRESPIDFLVRDTRNGKVILALENKTGRSAIREMSAFQLDVSDCDCILHDVRKLNVPAYIIQKQVLEVWEPPTWGFRAVGMWWADNYSMAANFRDVRTRQDEQRGAAYFKKAAFRDMDELAAALFDTNGRLELAERFRADGMPKLYQKD
jgi:hypothetical protein